MIREVREVRGERERREEGGLTGDAIGLPSTTRDKEGRERERRWEESERASESREVTTRGVLSFSAPVILLPDSPILYPSQYHFTFVWGDGGGVIRKRKPDRGGRGMLADKHDSRCYLSPPSIG